jgi:hypothetical protein
VDHSYEVVGSIIASVGTNKAGCLPGKCYFDEDLSIIADSLVG